jgi:hypothetical protein
MTGADIVGERLRSLPALLAVVSADRIKGGRLPAGIQIPALLVKNIGSTDRQPLREGATIRTDDRVRVTVRARSYDEQLRIIAMVATARARFIPAIAGAERVSIFTAGRGPDLEGPGDSYEQAQDFRVSFDRPAQPGD